MWHLAIECSGSAGSVALGESSATSPFLLVAEELLQTDAGSVRTLAPAIERVLKENQVAPAELGLISVTSGPGSFTGLRVGLTTAKMLSMAWKTPLVAVDTLAAIALRYALSNEFTEPTDNLGTDNEITWVGGETQPLVTVINAFRKQVFAAAWIVSPGKVQRAAPSIVLDAPAWLAAPWQSLSIDLSSAPLPVVTGPGLANYLPDSSKAQIAPNSLWHPLASQVAEIGWANYEAGLAVDAFHLEPNYIRASAAEERKG